VVLYELATGRLPHIGDTTVALLDAKLRLAPEPPRQRAPQRDLPKSLERAILRALERTPERRFRSALEMRRALEDALLEPGRVRHRRRRLGWTLTALVLVATASAAWAAAREPDIRERAVRAVSPVIHGLRSVKERLAAQRAAAIAADVETVAAPPSTPARPKTAPQPAAVAERAPLQADERTEDESAASEATEPTPDATETALAEARALSERGQSLRAFHQLRDLGARHPGDARVLRAWSEAALAVRSWGEAHRVARRWAQIDDSIEAQLHAARMERAVGDTDGALGVLRRLLERHPNSTEARELVRIYSGEAHLARQ